MKLLSDLQVTNAEDIGVFAGQTYTYYVTSSSKDNPDESAKSNEVSVAIPAEEEPEIPTEPVEPPADIPNIPGTPTTPDQPDVPSQGETPTLPGDGDQNGDTGQNPDQDGGDQSTPSGEQHTPSNGPAQEEPSSNQSGDGIGSIGNGASNGKNNGNANVNSNMMGNAA